MRAVTATGHLWTQGQKAGIREAGLNICFSTKMTKSDRDQRLAAKLRENLKRRKMQARARKSTDAPDPEDDSDADKPQIDRKPATRDD
jgi:alpha-D-ribose 1-methylphosphonate 5-triphosphate synthase subunit PhnG